MTSLYLNRCSCQEHQSVSFEAGIGIKKENSSHERELEVELKFD